MKTKKIYETAVRRAEARKKKEKKKEKKKHNKVTMATIATKVKKGSRARNKHGPNDQYKKKNQHPRKVRKKKGKYNGKSKTKTQKL